jgi:hypothetical protein
MSASTHSAHSPEVLLCVHSEREKPTAFMRKQSFTLACGISLVHQGFILEQGCRADTVESFVFPHLLDHTPATQVVEDA